MSEPRYPTGVSDPDQTTRIPKEALDGLRDADQARGTDHAGEPRGAVDGGREPRGATAAGANGTPAGGETRTEPRPDGPADGRRPDGARSGSGPAGARSGSTAVNGSSPGPAPAANGHAPDGAPVARPPVFGDGGASGPGPGPAGPAAGGPTAPAGYTRRSETGYSPSSYPGSYASAYPSPADQPTTVTAPAGAATATRGSVGTAGARPPARGAGGGRPPRRARLLVRHIDPWSTLKFSFVLAVAMFFVWLVAVGVLYGVLDGMGVFEQLNGLYDEVSGNGGDRLFSPGLVLGTATLIGAVNIVLFTALATIGAFVYNICSDLVGGIEVTLAERE